MSAFASEIELALLFVERRAENPRQVAHILGREEIVLHEMLNRRKTRCGGIAEPFGDFALQVEMQPLLGLAGYEMHMAAHRPQKGLGLAETRMLSLREDTLAGLLKT